MTELPQKHQDTKFHQTRLILKIIFAGFSCLRALVAKKMSAVNSQQSAMELWNPGTIETIWK